MGRLRASLLFNRIIDASKSINRNFCPNPPLISSVSAVPRNPFLNFRPFSALPFPSPFYTDDFDYMTPNFDQNQNFEEYKENEDAGKIPVKAFFLCTRQGESSATDIDGIQNLVSYCGYSSLLFNNLEHIKDVDWSANIPGLDKVNQGQLFEKIHGFGSFDLKSIQAENSSNVIPPTSRSSNYIALRFCDPPLQTGSVLEENASSCRYMVVFQYGSAVLFNVEDHEAECYLQHVRRYASGLLSEMKKDDYAIKEMPLLDDDMQGGLDHIILKSLDLDSIRIISSVLGQSIALDYFVSQVDGIVEEFTDINRGMEKSGNFTMDRKKLFQLVGKANSNLADVILKVGLFERSEIAWRDAKYGQILDYLREEYDVAQRFGNLDYKLKFIEHNIHFLQEALQNRKSDLLEWCIIVLLIIENVVGIYEIIHGSTGIAL